MCTRRLAEDARTVAELDAELELALVVHGRPGAPVSGTRDPGLELNPRAVDCRTDIRAKLVSWCLLIAEERGITTPADTVPAMAEYVATHAVWLSAHPLAFAAADELHELAHGLPWRTAYPTGVRRYPVADCPQLCGGKIRAVLRDTDALLPSALVCDLDPTHTWTAWTWRALGRSLHPNGAAGRYVTAHEIAATWRLPLGTVYRLAHEHGWRRTDDGRRPTYYLAEDVDATMRLRAVKEPA